MADSKITDLPILNIPANSDVFPIVDLANNTTKQIAVSSLRNSFTGNLASVSANWSSVYTNVNSNSANYILDGGNTKGTAISLGTNDNFDVNIERNNITFLTLSSNNTIFIPNSNTFFTDGVHGFRLRDVNQSNQYSISSVQGFRVLVGAGLTPGLVVANGNIINYYNTIMYSGGGASNIDILTAPRWIIGGTGTTGDFLIKDQTGNPGNICLGPNVKIVPDANNFASMRNGTNSQTFGIYKTFTDANNYERLVMRSTPGSTNFVLGSETSPGSATWRNIEFQTLTATRLTVKTNGAINFASLGADPSVNNSAGDVYYNSTLNALEVFNGIAYVPLNTSRTIATFSPLQNQPVSANFATLNTRNSDNLAVLQFSQGSPIREARFVGVIPDNSILINGLLIRTEFCTTSANTGTCRWGAQIKKLSTTTYAASAGVNVNVSGTANRTTFVASINLAAVDSLAAGEAFDLRIFRESVNASDTLLDAAQLLTVEVRANV